MTDRREESGPPDAGSWAAVLAAVELDVRRTEQLLAVGPADVAPSAGAPAEAMLPQSVTPLRPYTDAVWAALPDLADMPPVPAELGERIQSLRADIGVLQEQLAAEMRQWRAALVARRPRDHATATAGPAFFVDRIA